MRAAYAIGGRAVLLGQVVLVTLAVVGGTCPPWAVVLVFGLGLVHAGCERGLAQQPAPGVDTPHDGG